MKTKDSTVDLNRQLEAYAIASSSERNPQSRWGKWPIYAAATAAAIAGASAASADIIYSGPINISGNEVEIIPQRNHTIRFSVYLSPLRHFVSSVGPNGTNIPSANLNEEFGRVRGGASFFQSGGSLLKNFPAGAPIAGSLRGGSWLGTDHSVLTHQGHFVTSGGSRNNNFRNHGFLGMELVGTTGQHGVPTGSVEPGWIQVQFTGTFPGSFDITGWAYNTDGPINAGQTSATPEPSYLPLMLLAAGAAGVLAWKRSRRQQAPTPEAP